MPDLKYLYRVLYIAFLSKLLIFFLQILLSRVKYTKYSVILEAAFTIALLGILWYK